ncbi:MAG: hypothetical protein E6K45_08860, partial [Gammaproteobacteria bacterium]
MFFSDFHSFPRSLLVHRFRGEKTARNVDLAREPMKYLTFIRHSESYRKSGPPPALMEAMGKLVQKSTQDGILVDTGGLLPTADGARVRLARGKITVT